MFTYDYYLLFAEDFVIHFTLIFLTLLETNIVFPFIGHTKKLNLSASFAITCGHESCPLQQSAGRGDVGHFWSKVIKKQMCLLCIFFLLLTHCT